MFLPGTSRLLAIRVNGTTYSVQTDHLECPIRLLDQAGQVVWAAEPHGYEYAVLVNHVRQPFRFPGQYFDEETELHYNRHRYYDPKSGRYLSPDPLFFQDRTNLYLYAGDNPALFCDPSGLFLPLLIIGGALLIGAALGAGHSIASDLSQTKDVNWGNAAKAAGRGMLVAGGGVLAAGVAVATLPVTAPAAAVLAIGAVGALATGAIIAGVEAPEGQKAVACVEAIPFVRQFTHDYENDPNLKYPAAQRVIDGSFDLLTIGLMARGGRAARGRTVGDIRTTLKTPKLAEESQPRPLMSIEEAEALARQKNAEYRAELDAKIASGEMTQREAGPVAATVVDRATGKTVSAHNDRFGNPPKDMPEIVQRQVAESQADPLHPSEPGSHAEVHALSEAVKAREAGGQKVTKPDLNEFTQVSEWRKGSGDSRMKPGDDAPRCGNCQTCTDGVDNRSGDAPTKPPPSDD